MLGQYQRALVAGAVATIGVAQPVMAETQGSFGSNSTGSVTINASVPGRVRISGLRDVSFTNADPTANATDTQSLCVYSNTSTRGYNITATGSGAASAFTLASGALPVVPYTVQWASTSGAASGTSLTAATPLTGQTTAGINQSCSSGPPSSASLIVSIGTAALQSMSAGASYNGTLTLVVAPE